LTGYLHKLASRVTANDCDLISLVTQSDQSYILVFGLIDWGFRHQRPQHIATKLSKIGYTIIYISPTPVLSFRSKLPFILRQLSTRLFELRLCTLFPRSPCLHTSELTADNVSRYQHVIDYILSRVSIRYLHALVHHPYWYPLIANSTYTSIVYDCFDLHSSFFPSADPSYLKQSETALLQRANEVIVTSRFLHDRLNANNMSLITNGCDAQYFHVIDCENSTLTSKSLTVGYIGAVSHWFDHALLDFVCRSRPYLSFEIFGSIDKHLSLSSLYTARNVSFHGEVPYSDLPHLMSTFDVGIIPFIISDLTLATNPVKVYEYAASGLPVVSTALPELKGLEHIQIYTTNTAHDFVHFLDLALSLCRIPSYAAYRRQWAHKNDWIVKALEFKSILSKYES